MSVYALYATPPTEKKDNRNSDSDDENVQDPVVVLHKTKHKAHHDWTRRILDWVRGNNGLLYLIIMILLINMILHCVILGKMNKGKGGAQGIVSAKDIDMSRKYYPTQGGAYHGYR